jgi:flagellar assembly protein FliH
MKSFSFNELIGDGFGAPATSFLYQDIGGPSLSDVTGPTSAESTASREREAAAPPGLTAQEAEVLVNRARVEAAAETERQLRDGYEAKFAGEAAKVAQALEHFQTERKDYFSRIESEVVSLALAIAAKILHREAQVDPQLVAALVRIAVDRLHDGSTVTVRVSPERAGKWREFLAKPLNGSTITIAEDAHLEPGDCILETDLGSANFGIEAQLKEVEQGFFDLLAQRPVAK